MDILVSLADAIKFIFSGVVNFVTFFLGLPDFIYKLVTFIPEPIYSVLLHFLNYILFFIVACVSAKIISSVKG